MNIVSTFIVYLDLHKADSALGVYIAGAETTNISMLRWWLEHDINTCTNTSCVVPVYNIPYMEGYHNQFVPYPPHTSRHQHIHRVKMTGPH